MSIYVEKTNYLQLFSNFLSIITIVICFVLKVPQIFKLLNVKSARGINLVGLLMELSRKRRISLEKLTNMKLIKIACFLYWIPCLCINIFSYTIMMSYNYRNGYAILSYLEYPIILIQELILIFLVLKYKDLLNTYSLFGSGVYFSIASGFLLGMVPLGLLAFLVPLCTPIGASSKVVQLVEILRTKNAESISILTWFISAFTNFTRVFTILVESADLTLLLNFTINTFLSSSVMLAAVYYKNPKKDDLEKKFD